MMVNSIKIYLIYNQMFFLIFETPIKELKNRLRRLRKRRSQKNDDDPIVRKAVDRVSKLIREIGYSARLGFLSDEEKKEVVEYLKSLSNGLEWDFAYFFERECIPLRYSSLSTSETDAYLDAVENSQYNGLDYVLNSDSEL